MNRNEIKETLRQFILSSSLPGESPENLRDDMPLQTSGILDSFATLSLVGFIEQQFNVELDMADMSAEKFDTIEDIASSIERKR